MARVAICGFEINSLAVQGPDGQATGTGCSIVTTNARSGTYCARIVASGSVANYIDLPYTTGNGAAISNQWARIYILMETLPTSISRAILGNPAGSNLFVKINTDGTLTLLQGPSTVIGTSTTALTDTTRWYRIEIKCSTSPELRIDGTVEISGTSTSSAMNATIGAHETGVADSYIAYFDDWAVDDTTYPGDSVIKLLLPTSDHSRLNWTAGAGGTTSLFDAVDNIPPVGVASASETNTSNVESNSSTGTATYEADLPTYASIGINTGEIKTLRSVIVHGEDIATGTKTASALLQNPFVGLGTFTFGGDAGAHGAYSGGLWKVAETFQDSPTPSMVAANWIQVKKTDTTTRVGCICFMGLYVEYIPTVVAAPIPSPLVISQAAVRRAAFR